MSELYHYESLQKAFHMANKLIEKLEDDNERLRSALDKICGIVLGRKDGLSAARIHKITLEALNPAPEGKPG